MNTARRPPALPPPPAGYAKRMPRHPEARRLVAAGRDTAGRMARLTPAAAKAWSAMSAAAREAGVPLRMVSAFRSRQRQAEIVARKFRSGQTLASILRVSAYPGHSEHHTGRAIDVGSAARPELEIGFCRTPEYAWLKSHARHFGFKMTYPRSNRFGIAFEPWHWCHQSPSGRARSRRRAGL